MKPKTRWSVLLVVIAVLGVTVIGTAKVRAAQDNCQALRNLGFVCVPEMNCANVTWCVQGQTNCFPFFTVNFKYKKIKQQSRCTLGSTVVTCTACGDPQTDGCCADLVGEPDCTEDCPP